MPSAENNGEIPVPLLDGTGDLDGLLDHGSGDQRDTKAERILHLLEDPTLVIGRDRGIDDRHLVSRAKQGGGNGEQSKWRRRFDTGERRDEKDDFLRPMHAATS